MNIKKEIGLEAEVFLLTKEGSLAIALEHDLPSDGFGMLAEIRAKQGEDWITTVANMYTAFSAFKEKCQRKELEISNVSSLLITPEQYRKVMSHYDKKELPKYTSVYEKDVDRIMNISNVLLGNSGNILAYRVSCGLHIHFSLKACYAFKYKDADTKAWLTHVEEESILSKSILESIIKDLDKSVLPEMLKKFVGCREANKLSHRQPGLYEKKSWGFEYRSLPFHPEMMLETLETISKAAWETFDYYTKRI